MILRLIAIRPLQPRMIHLTYPSNPSRVIDEGERLFSCQLSPELNGP